MQRLRIQLEGREVEVIAEKLQGRLWFHFNGETYVFEPATDKKSAKAAVGLNPETIAAPMPGKILRVEINAGAKVKTGQVLIVMEAMKMEYTLTAAMDGEVTEAGCKPGEQVRLGQVLVRLKGKTNG